MQADNYQAMAGMARARFLTYDPEEILRTHPVRGDGEFIYLPVLDRTCRISRKTGELAWSKKGQTYSVSTLPADTLTVLDYLCDSLPGRTLSGEWVAMANFGRQFHTGLLEPAEAGFLERQIDVHPGGYHLACKKLGGQEFPRSDIGYVIPLFPDLPILVEFWHSDEEFPAQIRYFWDKNAKMFLKYETMFYAVGMLQDRICTLMDSYF